MPIIDEPILLETTPEPEMKDYDGLIEVDADNIDNHKEVFQWKELEGKVYFKFKYSERNKWGERCCYLMKK